MKQLFHICLIKNKNTPTTPNFEVSLNPISLNSRTNFCSFPTISPTTKLFKATHHKLSTVPDTQQCSTSGKIGGVVPPTVWNHVQEMMLRGINANWFLFVRNKHAQGFCLEGIWLRVLCSLTCCHYTFTKPLWRHTTNWLLLHDAVPLSRAPRVSFELTTWRWFGDKMICFAVDSARNISSREATPKRYSTWTLKFY